MTVLMQIEHYETSAKDTLKTKEVFDHLILRIMESKGMEVSKLVQKSSFKLGGQQKPNRPVNKSSCCNN
jgi:hypothetical protein